MMAVLIIMEEIILQENANWNVRPRSLKIPKIKIFAPPVAKIVELARKRLIIAYPVHQTTRSL